MDEILVENYLYTCFTIDVGLFLLKKKIVLATVTEQLNVGVIAKILKVNQVTRFDNGAKNRLQQT